MIGRIRQLARAALAVAVASAAACAGAHSASDAYLTLTSQAPGAGGETVVHGQWDVALRDLHFVLRLDDDGDGNITWAELRRNESAIARYVYPKLVARGDGKSCAVKPLRTAVTDHADGAYAALFFAIVCKGTPRRLTIDYRLLFAVDPSHRGIFVFRSGGKTATALLSPENATIEVGMSL